MPTVKIGIPYPANGVTIDRFGKRDMVVPYYIDGKGAFEVRLPIEEYTPDKAQQAVEIDHPDRAAPRESHRHRPAEVEGHERRQDVEDDAAHRPRDAPGDVALEPDHQRASAFFRWWPTTTRSAATSTGHCRLRTPSRSSALEGSTRRRARRWSST